MLPGHEMSDKTTKVGIRRCTIRLLPEGENEKEWWHDTKDGVVGETWEATFA